MDLKFTVLPAFVVAATTLAASPAFAQRRGREPHGNHHSGNRAPAGHSRPRGQAPPSAPAPQHQAPRITGHAVPRGEGPRYAGGAAAVPRTGPRNNSYYPRANYVYGSRGYYGPRYVATPWRGWYGYAPFRPYSFRPHLSIGFGVYVGYPVPYYVYPYPVPVYGYGAPYVAVNVGPNNPSYGGVALQIGPDDAVDYASVYADGRYAGVVSDFDGTRQPLTLTEGTHHIEIDQNGYQPLAFDVTVQPGMVTPYQASMQRY